MDLEKILEQIAENARVLRETLQQKPVDFAEVKRLGETFISLQNKDT